MDQKRAAGSLKKFFVHLAGETNRAHEEWVSKFKSISQSEVKSSEESDYILLFCPIVSRVGTDISVALQKAPGGKKIVLIVMHHTFNPKSNMAESKGLVENKDRVILVVDCLFHKGRLLKSISNDRAWSEIKGFFPKEVSLPRLIKNTRDTPAQDEGSLKKFFVLLAGETKGAHKDWIWKFNSIGHSQVKSPEESDYILLFCSIVSQARTDISEALKKTPGGKKIILIVMHYTFSPKHITDDSKRLVENRDVVLVVDSLFDKGCLLKSRSNDHAWSEIKRFFGDPEEIEVPFWKEIINRVQEKQWSLDVSYGTVAVVILASVAYHIWHKQQQRGLSPAQFFSM